MKTKVQTINQMLDKLAVNFNLATDYVSETRDNLTLHTWYVTSQCGYFDVFDIRVILDFAQQYNITPFIIKTNDDEVAFKLFIFL